MKYSSLSIDGYQRIGSQYHLEPLLAKMLATTGWDDSQMASFLNAPNQLELETADCLNHAAQLLKQAKQNGEMVFIFGDYDCDGLCATAIMYQALTTYGLQCGYYIPNRLSEGYGLNLNRLKQAYDKGYRVLVTVDNGVKASEALAWASEHQMVVIVTDHHLIDQPVNCTVLVHPSLLAVPQQQFCGAAVALAIANQLKVMTESMVILAMTATLGDMVPLQGQNIALVRTGLQLLNNGVNSNLVSLVPNAKLPWTADDINFKVVPRLNAVGRLADIADPNKIVAFLISSDPVAVAHYASDINQLNIQRQKMTAAQLPKLKAVCDLSKPLLLINMADLHEGLIGLLAGHLAKEYLRPVIVMTENNGILKGSARSIPGFDINKLLAGYPNGYLAFGGHTMACGVSLEPDNLASFEAYLQQNMPANIPEPVTGYCPLNVSDLTSASIEQLLAQQPFGQGRQLPLVGLENPLTTDYRMLKTSNQLKWMVDLDNSRLSILSFSDNDGFEGYTANDQLCFIGRLSVNVFAGRRNYDLLCEKIVRK